jgi:hypothetical protein
MSTVAENVVEHGPQVGIYDLFHSTVEKIREWLRDEGNQEKRRLAVRLLAELAAQNRSDGPWWTEDFLKTVERKGLPVVALGKSRGRHLAELKESMRVAGLGEELFKVRGMEVPKLSRLVSDVQSEVVQSVYHTYHTEMAESHRIR